MKGGSKSKVTEPLFTGHSAFIHIFLEFHRNSISATELQLANILSTNTDSFLLFLHILPLTFILILEQIYLHPGIFSAFFFFVISWISG